MKKKTTEEFKQDAKKKHGDKYGYDEVDYINSKTNVKIFCKACNDHFLQKPNHHLSGQGCPTCGIVSRVDKRRKPKEEFIIEAIKVHGDKYGYEDVKYINNETYVEIFCKSCNTHFPQTPGNHLSGHGCPTCGIVSRVDKRRKPKEEFIIEAIKVHEEKYGYEDIKYINALTYVDIFCKACNKHFQQTPASHLSGRGCPTCGGTRKSTTEEFVEKAIKVHGDKYGYEDVKYEGNNIYVNILCKACNKHFQQFPYSHLAGHGCPTCSSTKSYSDISIKWLEFMMTEHKIHIQHALNGGEYKIPGTSWRADGFCVETNTIYEFHGDFWHGNPIKFNSSDINTRTHTTFGELYENTQKRKQTLIEMGYNYVEMWEYDWKSG